jgi:Helix-turn-helix domain
MAFARVAFSLSATRQPAAPARAGAKLIRSARSQGRAKAFNHDLDQWKRYALSMANTSTDLEAVEAEYLRRYNLGPAWATAHTGSEAIDAPVNKISHDDKRATLEAFDMFRRWQHRNDRGKHGQAVSKNYREVLSVLLTYALRYGRCFPSQARIAELVCCSEKTVRRALAWLRVMGFLTWRRRLRDKPHPSGSRQASNAYVLVERVRLAFVGTQLFQRLSGHKFRPSSDDHPETPHDPQLELLLRAQMRGAG